MKKKEFQECPTCAARPGTPTLCEPCLNNRSLISGLGGELKIQEAKLHHTKRMLARSEEEVKRLHILRKGYRERLKKKRLREE